MACVQRASQETQALLQQTYELRNERDQLLAIRETAYGLSNGQFLILDEPPVPDYPEEYPEVLHLREAEDVSRSRGLLRDLARQAGMEEELIENLLLAYGEAATNALNHGTQAETRIFRDKGLVAFMVSDHGEGIPIGDLPNCLFRPFLSERNSLGVGLMLLRVSINGPQRIFTQAGYGTIWLCDQWLTGDLASEWRQGMVKSFVLL